MQYKKDEIKEKIDAAALAVFTEKGYLGAKISDIGKLAGISVGNIYRYYSSKDEIFYANVGEDFIEDAKVLLAEKISTNESQYRRSEEHKNNSWLVNEEVINFMVENRSKAIIVFWKSKGTKYENSKVELVEFILSKVGENIFEEAGIFKAKRSEGHTAGIIYSSLIDMVLSLLEESKDSEALRRSLQSVNTYHMSGITGFLTETANALVHKEELYGNR
jgi:AcrR family transcriptional regulator